MRTNIVSILRDKAGGVVTAFRKKVGSDGVIEGTGANGPKQPSAEVSANELRDSELVFLMGKCFFF
jgi:hypothetical protein